MKCVDVGAGAVMFSCAPLAPPPVIRYQRDKAQRAAPGKVRPGGRMAGAGTRLLTLTGREPGLTSPPSGHFESTYILRYLM